MTGTGQTELPFDEPADALTQPPLAERYMNCGMSEHRLYEIPDIRGLYYFPDFLDDNEQSRIIKQVDTNESQWRNDLERRVQHYGWRYDYRSRTITSDMELGPLPDWIKKIAGRLYDEAGLFDQIPGQVIVNEYNPGQGIALHADRDCFGDAVATISLGDDWEMKLRPLGGKSYHDKFVMLQHGSALILTGDARYRWMHGIDKRKGEERDTSGQFRRQRRRRISLTFRTVISAMPRQEPY